MSRNDCVFCACEDTNYGRNRNQQTTGIKPGNFCHYYKAKIQPDFLGGPPPVRHQESCEGFSLLRSMRFHWERNHGEKWTAEIADFEIREKPLIRLSEQDRTPVYTESLRAGKRLDSLIGERKKVLIRAWQLRDHEESENGCSDRYQRLENDCCEIVGDLQDLVGINGSYLESGDLQTLYAESKQPNQKLTEPPPQPTITKSQKDTVKSFWKVEIPASEFGLKEIISNGDTFVEIIALPTSVIRSFADTAQALDNLLTGRTAKFAGRIDQSKFPWRRALAWCLKEQDGRFFCIKEGLCRGGSIDEPAFYFGSESSGISYMISANEGRRKFDNTPIHELLASDFDVIISYSREDLPEARSVADIFRAQSIRCYLIDVEDDPDDPFWWLRYALALRKSRYLVPLLSKNYMESRERATHDEAMQFLAEIDRMKEIGNWFPVIPVKLSDWQGEKSIYQDLFSAIPVLETDLSSACHWIAQLIQSPSHIPSFVEQQFQVKPVGDQLEVFCGSGSVQRLVISPEGVFRLVDLPAKIRAASFSALSMTSEKPEDELTTPDHIWANALAKQGYWFSSLLFRCREAVAEDFSVATMIKTGEAFHQLGLLTEARHCYGIAYQVTKNSVAHSKDTVDKVDNAMADLAAQSFQSDQINLNTEIQPWLQLTPARKELTDYPLGLPYPYNEPQKHASATYAGNSLNSAKVAGDRGDFHRAELEALAAAQQSPGASKSFPFYIASQCAVQNQALDRAETYLIFALELDPENNDIKHPLIALWEHFETLSA